MVLFTSLLSGHMHLLHTNTQFAMWQVAADGSNTGITMKIKVNLCFLAKLGEIFIGSVDFYMCLYLYGQKMQKFLVK